MSKNYLFLLIVCQERTRWKQQEVDIGSEGQCLDQSGSAAFDKSVQELLCLSPCICCTWGTQGKYGAREGKETIRGPPLWLTAVTAISTTSKAKKVMSNKSGEFLSHLDANGKCWTFSFVTLRASFCPCDSCGGWKGAVWVIKQRLYCIWEKNVSWGKKSSLFFNLYVILNRSGHLFSYWYS